MKDKRRRGFTTGSCAAAASKAAGRMLLTGEPCRAVRILTPGGIPYEAEILEITRTEDSVRCAVRKDGGEDPDVTSGALIFAEARLTDEPEIMIQGGIGVGTVTRPGLDQPVGAAAINSVPRQMIRHELLEEFEQTAYRGGMEITISVPQGEELARRTFNPRLGITGGISIIGTSGIVEPMSTQAILDTIGIELRQRRAEGLDAVFLSPGNYGAAFLAERYGIDLDRSVKCSNYLGQTIDRVRELGFRRMLLAGHSGKLVKAAGGIMNTHSAEADCRMELIAAAAIRAGASREALEEILDALTTEEAFRILQREGLLRETCERLLERILWHLRRRASEALQVECILYANEFGLLAQSEGAEAMIRAYKERWNG